MRRISLLVALAVTAVLVGLARPAVAETAATPVSSCGQNLLAGRYYLTRDLRCAAGFVVEDENEPESLRVTIDLRGHRLIGPGSGSAVRSTTAPVGSEVVVRNGQLSGWGTAVDADDLVTLDDVQAYDNDLVAACYAICTVSDSQLRWNRTVFTVADLSILDVDHTALTRNDLVVDLTADHPTVNVTDSYLSRNRVALSYGSWPGLSLTARGNTFSHNGVAVAGARLVPTEDTPDFRLVELTDNGFYANGDGIKILSTAPLGRVTLARNRTVGNTRYGIYAPGATDGGGNLGRHNGRPCVGVRCGTT